MKATGRFLQTSSAAPREGMRDNLHAPRRDGSERSSMPPLVPGIGPRRTSLTLVAQMHPAATFALAGLALALRERGGTRPPRSRRGNG